MDWKVSKADLISSSCLTPEDWEKSLMAVSIAENSLAQPATYSLYLEMDVFSSSKSWFIS